jgi:SRSO17 transposase
LIADDRTWPLTFELYLPQSWMADPARRTAAGIPQTLRFREKWRIALAHVRTVLKAGFRLTGIVVDADYGSNARFRDGLERLGLVYGVAIRGDGTFWTPGARRTRPAAAISAATPLEAWQSVTWNPDTLDPVPAAFYAVRVRAPKGRGERWLLCERLRDDTRKYYLLNLAPTATLRDLVLLARSRWPIEQQYRELKDNLGLDHFEGRRYQGWGHHVVLTAVAFTFLQLERARTVAVVRPTLPVVRDWVREIFGLLYVIHNRRLQRMLVSFQRNPLLRR